MFQDSVPAGSYNDPFLSSVIPMVAPTWCHRALWGNLLCGVNVDRREFWIVTFELVIHLSKGQQLAFPFISFLRCPVAPDVPGIPVIGPFMCSCAELHKPPFLQHLLQHHGIIPRQLHQAGTRLSGVVFFLFWLSGEVIHFVHLIRWNSYSCLCLYGTTRTRACCGTIARPIGLGTESCCNYLFWFVLSPTSPPFGP